MDDSDMARRIAERRKDEDFQRRLAESLESNREALELLAKGDEEEDETVGELIVAGYSARTRRAPNGTLWAEVVTLPGCFASGRDERELRAALAEAIALYADGRE